jgi:hypothetical protein
MYIETWKLAQKYDIIPFIDIIPNRTEAHSEEIHGKQVYCRQRRSLIVQVQAHYFQLRGAAQPRPLSNANQFKQSISRAYLINQLPS